MKPWCLEVATNKVTIEITVNGEVTKEEEETARQIALEAAMYYEGIPKVHLESVYGKVRR